MMPSNAKQREAAKILPKLLNFYQKQSRINIAQEILMTFNNDPDLVKKGNNFLINFLHKT